MPSQDFSLNATSAPLARVHWDNGYQTIDLTYSGSLLTRITDAQSLRTTGLQGHTSDGATLVLRLTYDSSGEHFALERNGAAMHGGPVDYAIGGPLSAATGFNPSPYGGVAAVGGATFANEKAMKSGRRWLRGLGILSLVVGVVLLIVGGSNNSDIADPGQLKLIGIIVAIFGAVYIALAQMAKGPRSKTMFGVGMVLTGLNATLNLVNLLKGNGSQLVGVAISVLAFVRVRNAWQAARTVTK